MAPGEDGEFSDWVDHDGVLYIFKDRGIHRLTGNEPRLYMCSRVEGADGVISRTAASCGNVVMYATETGIYPIGKSQMGVPRSFSLNIENAILPYIEDAQATYSEELNCYLLTIDRHEFFVANLSVRPDVWTQWEYRNPGRAADFVYARSGLWMVAGNTIYAYDPEGVTEAGQAMIVQLRTGSWNMENELKKKNVRFVQGRLNTAGNSAIRVTLYLDDPGAIAYAYRETIAAGGRNLLKCNKNCQEIEMLLEFQQPTGIIEFGGAELLIRPLGDSK